MKTSKDKPRQSQTSIQILSVKIIPKAHKTEIIGWENDELKIRLKAIPEKGEANSELTQFLAKFLEIAKSNVALVSGHKSRHKKLKIEGISQEDLKKKLQLF